MTPDELRASLTRIGWTQRELSRQTGVTTVTINRWVKRGPIPPWVPAFLSNVEAVAAMARKVGV